MQDQDSGLGSSAQLNSSPTHKAFLDYDNLLPPAVPSAYLSEVSLPVPPAPRNADPTSPRRNSESARIVQAIGKPQRRAVSASRVTVVQPKQSETKRKRQYRVGLNLFNK